MNHTVPLSKAKIKLIRSLEQRKYRLRHRLFVVEGDKIVREALASPLTVSCVLAGEEWLGGLPAQLLVKTGETVLVGERELSQISFLKTPNQAVALVRIPQYGGDGEVFSSGLSLYLDQVQDPGNLGAILRVADWFGIPHVLCGEGCADPYHPKSVQSSMGAIIRVKTYPSDVSFFSRLASHTPEIPVYGTFLNGESIYGERLPEKAVIVMGNESKGIGREVAQFVDRRIYIPSYPAGTLTSESLNVAAATAVVCSEFRRKDRATAPNLQ
ncbi:MAG: RNA methyltransferase [Bacteroidales bacterium]|nr:RNA methyltransferase [Bacteroidales bacterium]